MTKKLETAAAKLKAVRASDWSVIRIQDEMDKLVKIFSHMRECLENEMMDGLGYTKKGVSSKLIEQAGDLAAMMDKIVSSKIRYDKAAKDLAESMTPEEEREACTKYIQSLDYKERAAWMDNMRQWMKRRNEIVYRNTGEAVPDEGNEPNNELVPDELA